MNNKVKTALIVALSLFGAGVIIFLCVSMSVHFDYSKLSTNFQIGTNNEARIKAEHIDKDIEASGQDIKLSLIPVDVTVTQSADDMIHISYDNSENTYFKLNDSASQLTLTQEENGKFFFGFLNQNDKHNEVVLSVPAGHDGALTINGVSSDISISGIEILKNFKIHSVSGEVYAENVKTSSMELQTVSGDITLKNVAGQKASLSTTSGGVELNRVDFTEIIYNTVSGDIEGTVRGASEDYTVYTKTISGENSLSAHKGRGERTLDLSSTSGSFDISFEK